ncbi:ATP-binding protein [Petrachloros mirabilis]
MPMRWFQGVRAWMVTASMGMILFAVLLNYALDRQSIEQANTANIRAASLAAAHTVSRIIGKSGDIRDVAALKEVFQDIFDIRPNFGRLSVYEVLPHSNLRIYSSDPDSTPTHLSQYERNEVAAGRSVIRRFTDGNDFGWVVTAPIAVHGEPVGALQGQFSVRMYDELLQVEGRSAQKVGLVTVVLSSLLFLTLVRVKIQKPISELIRAMRQAEARNLTSHVQVQGPADIQELARQFNQMLDRIHSGLVDRELLHREIRTFNDRLVKAVAEKTTELDRTNQLLVEARLASERASKLAALGELSSVVAHELGNPLNAISGHLQLLERELRAQSPNRHLTIVRAEIERMVSIIQQILDSTNITIQSDPVDLNAEVQEVCRLIAPSLAGRHIVLKTDLSASLNHVASDRQALHGVIFNLANNAIQAMPHGGELEFVTQPSIGGTDTHRVFFQGARLHKAAVRLIVRDTGCGISPEHLTRIFEPFFTTRHDEGGTGLGLAFCQRVIASMGGCIGVESMIGHGTRFVVDLPQWNGAA